jgi:hypothetical protein
LDTDAPEFGHFLVAAICSTAVRADFATGKIVLLAGKSISPTGKALSPGRKIVSPGGKTLSPTGKFIFPTGKIVSRGRKMIFPVADKAVRPL